MTAATRARAKSQKSRRSAQAALPEFIEPCLAKLADTPPEGVQWVHEVKFDGYRLQARIEAGKVRLLTRTGLDWTAKFGRLADVLARLPVKAALIDGEAVVEDQKGATSFVELVDELKNGRPDRIAFVAFDLLHLDGVNFSKEPLLARKRALQTLIGRSKVVSHVRYSDHVVGNGAAMLAEVCKIGLEGVVSKRIDKPYRPGRHGDWIKSKCLQSDEFVIGGYLDSTAIKSAVGALALGFYQGRKLIYAGRVGTGFSRATAMALWQQLQPLRRAVEPFASPLDAIQAKGVVYVAPRLVAVVAYRAWTGDGLLRHASFKALREDKPANKVTKPRMHHLRGGSR